MTRIIADTQRTSKRWGWLSEPAWVRRDSPLNLRAARRATPTFSRVFSDALSESLRYGHLLLLPRRAALELRGELLDAACGIDQAFFAGIGGVGIHRHVTRDDEIFHAVDLLLASGLHGRLGDK